MHCCHKVQIPNMLMRWRECKNKGKVVRGGKLYCGLHDPEKKDKRQEKLEEKRKKRYEQKRKLNQAYMIAKSRRQNETHN